MCWEIGIDIYGLPCSSAGKESSCNAGDPSSIPGSGSSPGEGIGYPLQYSWGFPRGSDSKEPSCIVGELGSIPGLGRSPGGGHGNPLQYSCLENPHGQRSLVGCSPWGRKEQTLLSNFTFTFHFHALEKEMATHSSVLAWRIPGMGSHRVGHD